MINKVMAKTGQRVGAKRRQRWTPDERRAHRRECWTMAAIEVVRAASNLLDAVSHLDGPEDCAHESHLEDAAVSALRRSCRWLRERRSEPR